MDMQEQVIATLRAHESELRAAGVRSLLLFGSVARSQERPGSDVDLAVRLDPDSRLGLFRFLALENHLSDLLGQTVQLLPEPLEPTRLLVNLSRDARRVF